MRIVCPTCSAAYDVTDALLKPGRAVRCVRCGEEWTPSLAAPPPEPEPVLDEPSQAPEPAPPEPTFPRSAPAVSPPMRPTPPRPRANTGLRAAWLASIVVLLLFGWGAYTWRGEVMRSWPPSTRLYDALGLTPPR